MKTSLLTLSLCLLLVCTGIAQKADPPVPPASRTSYSPDPELSITKHSITITGVGGVVQKINYTATAGYLPQRDESGKIRANIFFVAYTRDGVTNPASRPITYTYNGGPGSASVWLHMGALGPKRILMGDDGTMLAPPYTVSDNEFTWLAFTDLVFIDPVMTGYSRPAEGVDKKEFTGYVEDIQSVGDFIRLYTTRYDRWGSPKFLAGESYGTTRSAGLSGYLQDRHGLFLNGIVLISAVLDFTTIQFAIGGNELPYSLFLPTYAAMAWYHKQVPAYKELKTLLKEVEAYAAGDYTLALMKGDKLTPAERQAVAAQLNKFTGLSVDYLLGSNLRIRDSRFTKELLRKQGRTVGRLDGRFTASDYDRAGESTEFDPSYNATIYGPFTTAVNDHLHRVLNVKNDLPYEILTGRVRPWNYSNVQNQFLNTAETLRNAMTKNPYLKVHVCNGYYDMATPYFATEYTFSHMMLDPALKSNVTMSYYEAGHMMYIDRPALIDMTRHVADFYKTALPK
ncbi:carboxypeptidase C (cathepsin A) [Spirosoma lacussanchae]|uniref:S10 family peptidase n=1 Tax=Spirosoma lacussanchae TaxID=1884249 RepID=UPI0011088D69|nr:peptidase S10 [Spirosoma lacussanchae]